ncbi:phosphoribosylformylglycinamidine synthase PurLQS, glutaminase subunit PurQ [Campylobacter lari]|uniref:phosphoribosylformylglycinamidine synthase subunit PurQ n=1 Tax=Campylobacter lari TaxID=201 RepID=UPI0012857ABD|nr:phosphoribosylformylglycinamidine synthase subunit PurQ [Campylobacter lari]EAI4298670.1 phosphoribosylformylglycinamidine synthase subunit PurQ [Campylobacter lari]EAK0445883.1 phosphoribosylformylglycinamidine synthase subunit PurQ [Campylobacter lari]MCR6517023.1 phosphoribosylformylglycinamidine synthase subunit PurQ [Campylobacter lari]MCR6520437.1 phosphoribosylformylglycinamidine synthase subunit PurQ [Campylobacter lari]HEC1773685.1 phosphoribosylformylglycinamidine synthase subunit
MKVAIIRFPGTNCEFDTAYAFEKLGVETEIIWHERQDFSADLIVLPGGFSYGDYLRCAAIAKLAPAMKTLKEHVQKGGYVLGICNGFQILLELGLLKGAMKHNNSLSFISKMQALQVVSNNNAFLKNFQKNDIIELPIAHGEGNYFNSEDGIKMLEDKDMILLRYINNPNGSLNDIAGICDENKKVFGLMPHPERMCDDILGSKVGLKMFEGFLNC